MGAWIALLAALARPLRVAGMVLIAPAPDFTEDLLWARLPDAARREIETTGEWLRPSSYDPDPYPIMRALIKDERKHRLLRQSIQIHAPVLILHGMADPDVPWQHALRLVERLESNDAAVELVKHGDHRLSAPSEIVRLENPIERLVRQIA